MTEMAHSRMPYLQARSCLYRDRTLAPASWALLAIIYVLTPHPSLASVAPTVTSPSASAVNCSPAPVTSTRQCHLDLNDRMKMDLGTWGNGVHPRGPNYFCVEHHKQLEEAQNRRCR
jgi:hypothetical protein